MHLDIRIKAIKFTWFKAVSVWMFSDQKSKLRESQKSQSWFMMVIISLSNVGRTFIFLCVL